MELKIASMLTEIYDISSLEACTLVNSPIWHDEINCYEHEIDELVTMIALMEDLDMRPIPELDTGGCDIGEDLDLWDVLSPEWDDE